MQTTASAILRENSPRNRAVAPVDIGNPKTGEEGRHYVDESLVQEEARDAFKKTALTKRTTCLTFLHSFATHLFGSGYGIQTVQELLGHNDVETTAICYLCPPPGTGCRLQTGGRSLMQARRIGILIHKRNCDKTA